MPEWEVVNESAYPSASNELVISDMKSMVFLVELQFLGFRESLDSDSSLKSRISWDCDGLAFSMSCMLSIVNNFSIVQYYAHYLYLV
jgi:hypothetical protein